MNAGSLCASLSLCASVGCTFETGDGYLRLDRGELTVALEHREDALQTSLGYEVRLEMAEIEIESLEFISGEEPTTSVAFDAHVHHAFDLLAPTTKQLDEFEPAAELGRVQITHAMLTEPRLTLRGQMSSQELRELEFELALPLAPFETEFPWVIDESAPAQTSFEVELTLPAALLDEIEFGDYASDKIVELKDDETEAAEQLRSNASRAELHVALDYEPAHAEDSEHEDSAHEDDDEHAH